MISSTIENGADSINMTSAIFYQACTLIGLPQSIADKIYINFAEAKENVISQIESYVKNQQAYYVGRTIADAALIVMGVAGVKAGVDLIMAGLVGEVGSAVVEELSLGTGTPAVAVAMAVSTAAVVIGAAVTTATASLALNSTASLPGDVGKIFSSSKSNSLILRENMIKAGMQEPSYKPNVAHHIVPAEAAKAQEARDILKKCGIDDINCAENGVFLPGEQGLAGAENASVHTGRHLDSYITEVTNRLKSGLPANPTAANKENAIEILNSIRQDLLNGTLKLQK